jgi:NADPH:quinone reductase
MIKRVAPRTGVQVDTANHSIGLQLRSLIKQPCALEVSLHDVATPKPAANEVVLRVEASPINPSDIGLLFGPADMNTAQARGTPARPVVIASVPESTLSSVAGRIGLSLPVGNEGAGIVVASGSSAAAQALLGKTVAVFGGAMYSQFRCVAAEQCLVLPDGVTPAQGASAFVNPLTALGMVETMRREGHSALVHTAAASSLGQMLNRICIRDRIALVNIVRRPQQAELLRSMGATHVCDSSEPTFMRDLKAALHDTGATIAFDALGGGSLAGQILFCMEAAIQANAAAYSRYGSEVHKQVYLYGILQPGATELRRNFGMAWGVGGWLLSIFLRNTDPMTVTQLKHQVATEIATTFASRYSKTLSLAEALDLNTIAAYYKRETGEKYLIDPNQGI